VVAKRLFVLGTAMIGLTGISTTLWAQSVGVAYVAHFGGGVSADTIDATTGALTPVPGSPFPTGLAPVSVTTTAGAPPPAR